MRNTRLQDRLDLLGLRKNGALLRLQAGARSRLSAIDAFGRADADDALSSSRTFNFASEIVSAKARHAAEVRVVRSNPGSARSISRCPKLEC
jgi:hypothetical protein